MKILYPIIDGEITGGNMICLKIIEEALKKGYRVVVNSPSEGKATHILREKGLKVYNIDTRRTFYFHSAIKLAHIIKKEDITLIHSHTPLAGTILARLAGFMAKVPVINHAHLPDYLNRHPLVKHCQLLLNWITSKFFCAKIIAVSEGVKKEIINQAVAADKIEVVYNGIDLDNSGYSKNPSKIRREFGLKQNQKIVGEVGRLCKNKGQYILVKAAQKVIEKVPGAVFMIVGEDLEAAGEYEKELKNLANDLRIKQQVIFTGYRSDIMDLIHCFDVFALPSAIEGLPVVILEAMAAKRPVITTPGGGSAEIVIDGETGTTVPAKDPDKLAEAIVHYLQNPEISRRMGEKGYERVRDYFSLSQMVNKVMDIYKEILVDYGYKI